jgi:hypothetical protein
MAGFTHKQVLWIRERDRHRCQFHIPHKCFGRLEVHHLRPQIFCIIVHKLPDIRFNVPCNALTVCQNAHQTILHPDTHYYLEEYRKGDHEAFEKMQKRRKDYCLQGVRYWVDTWDEELFEIAKKRTEAFEALGHIFPKKGR